MCMANGGKMGAAIGRKEAVAGSHPRITDLSRTFAVGTLHGVEVWCNPDSVRMIGIPAHSASHQLSFFIFLVIAPLVTTTPY